VDVRRRLSFSGSWDLPFGSGRALGSNWSGLTEQILGGWSVGGILTASDGNWTNLRVSINRSRSRQVPDTADRPSLIPGGDNSPVLSDGREPTKYFDPNQFTLGPEGYFGTVGRNTLNRPGVFTSDFSIRKDFHFSEEKYLQFRVEMFNIANRANFGSPSTTVIRSSRGSISSTAGRITSTTTTSRQIQFALKLIF